MEARGKPTRIPFISYIALFLIAFCVRFFFSVDYFLEPVDAGARNFEVFDSCYHMRRVQMTLDDFPNVPFRDTYHYFPENPTIPWPAGYTLFLTCLAKPIDMIFQSTLVTETVVGILPCVIDALTVILFLFFFSRYIPFPTAWIAALLLALSLLNVSYARTGYIDHHYFINFLIALSACLFSAFDRKPAIGRGIGTGIFLGCMLYFNVSLIQYVLLFLCALLAGLLMKRGTGPHHRAAPAVFLSCLAASVLVALTAPAGRSLQIRYDEISLFQPLLILFAILASGLVILWLKPDMVRKRFRIPIMAVLLLGAIALAAATFKDVFEGARFLLAGNRLNKIQSEEFSILGYGAQWQGIFTWCVIFLPLGFHAFFRQERDKPLFFSLVSFFFLHGLLAGLAHLLYVHYLYPWYALLLASGMQYLVTMLKPRLGAFRYAVLLPFVIQVGYVAWTQELSENESKKNERRFQEQVIESLAWLREHSPETSHFEKGDGPPEYSVMAHRDWGHLIVRIARRPVTTSPFSTPAFLEHMQDYIRLTFSRTEAEAAAIMDQYRSRYLVLDERDNRMADFLLGILEGEEDHAKYASYVTPASLNFLFRNNLLIFDGILNWQQVPAASRFRLIYEGRSKLAIQVGTSAGAKTLTFTNYKIYEYVKGVRVMGKGYRPGERVAFQLPLVTNTGRRFTYSAGVTADENGRISIVLPYATEKCKGSAVTPEATAYQVIAESRKTQLTVPIRAVLDGESIALE
jgi:asparagine N-glycosylation enzyme membrane subunit Stt3